MDFDHYRRDWVGRRPVNGPPFDWSKIDTIAIHYPGVDWAEMDFNKDGRVDFGDTARLLLDTHLYYLDARGYSIGYSAAVDRFGHTWELRGDTFRAAANKGWNHRTFSILVVVDADDAATQPQIEGVRRLVAQVEQRVPDVAMVPHCEIGSTACPGKGVLGQLRDGLFWPTAGSEVDVIVLDYKPNTPQWVRLAWDGISTVAHVRSGHVAAVHTAAGVKTVPVDRVQLQALLEEPAAVKKGPNPFVSGDASDVELAVAWDA